MAQGKLRKITVISMRGDKTNIITRFLIWSSLKKQLLQAGIDLTGIRPITSTRITLEHPRCQIPKHDFNLFLMPSKIKHSNHN